MNKFIIIFVVLLQSCFENAQDSTGHNTLNEKENLLKCNLSISELAQRYLEHPDSRDILLRASGYIYKGNALECQEVLQVSLPNYLKTIKRMFTYVGLEYIPITENSFLDFIDDLKIYFEMVDDLTNVDKKVEILNKMVQTENRKNPEDYVKAFHEISSTFAIETKTTLFQQIRSLGLNPIKYPTKQLLMKAIVDRAIEAEKEKADAKKEKADAKKETLVMKAKYSFPAVMEEVQHLLSPGWIEEFGDLTRNTIWTIILNRKDSVRLNALLRRIRACYPFWFTIEDVKEFVLSKFSSNCNCVHRDRTDFPYELNENEWEDVLSGMGLSLWDRRERCIVRSMAKYFEVWELDAVLDECKAGDGKKVAYDVFIWLDGLPIHHSERAIKTRLEIHLTKYDKQLDGKVINVTKLEFVNRKDSNIAVVQFINEVSVINAMNVLNKNPLILENCTISAYELSSGTF